MSKLAVILNLVAVASLLVSASAQHQSEEGAKFTVCIENIFRAFARSN
jgi:hypothetical protein